MASAMTPSNSHILFSDLELLQQVWIEYNCEVLYFLALLRPSVSTSSSSTTIYTQFRQFFDRIFVEHDLSARYDADAILDFEAFAEARDKLPATRQLLRLVDAKLPPSEHMDSLVLTVELERLESFYAARVKAGPHDEVNGNPRWNYDDEWKQFLQREAFGQNRDFSQLSVRSTKTLKAGYSDDSSERALSPANPKHCLMSSRATRAMRRAEISTGEDLISFESQPTANVKETKREAENSKVSAAKRLMLSSTMRNRGTKGADNTAAHPARPGSQSSKQNEALFDAINSFISNASDGLLGINSRTRGHLYAHITSAVNAYRQRAGIAGDDRSYDSIASKWLYPRNHEIKELKDRILEYEAWDKDTSLTKPQMPLSDPKIGVIYTKSTSAESSEQHWTNRSKKPTGGSYVRIHHTGRRDDRTGTDDIAAAFDCDVSVQRSPLKRRRGQRYH
ncbi:hypothetical protein NX059_008137 [Plenodomus lindquistii]|nr:hypothetical protein NX059_008137 [Plenodomus lindquistii]